MTPIAIGRVRTSFGLDGSVKVHSFSGETAHFLQLDRVEVRHKSKTTVLSVEHVRCSGNTPIMKFRGIDTPEAAKALRGAELWVERTSAAPLDTDEFYVADLVALELRYRGAPVGKVASVIDGPDGALLEVKGGRERLLVPFRDPFIGAVDIRGGTVELLVDWILE